MAHYLGTLEAVLLPPDCNRASVTLRTSTVSHVSSNRMFAKCLGPRLYGVTGRFLFQTLDEYPENLSLMTLKVRLQEIIDGPESALNTAKGLEALRLPTFYLIYLVLRASLRLGGLATAEMSSD